MAKKPNVKSTEKVCPTIYAYTTPGVTYHDGWTKIGYTERNVEDRINEQTQTANIKAHKEWQDIARFYDGTPFSDKEFHAYLSKNGIERMDPQPDAEGRPEWFHISGIASRNMFSEFRYNKGIMETLGVIPYDLRDEQNRAVEQTKNYFSGSLPEPAFLWNAKPRFGKTLATYDLCKKLKVRSVLIVTNRPAIANSWYSDYVKFMGTDSGYYFVSETDSLKGKKYVLSRDDYLTALQNKNHSDSFVGCIEFLSLQDLKGSIYFGGKHNKLKEISTTNWGMLVIDEAHEGVDTTKTDVAFEQIRRKYTLHLSGTPFKALANDKFPEKAIFNWTYADEQTAKRNWDASKEEENPYENLPQLNLFTYKLSDIVRDKVEAGAVFTEDGDEEDYCWDLNEFFKPKSDGTFAHDADVDKFLDALTTQEKFPFSTPELRDELKHTLWLLKYVASAKALAKKLKEHPVFKDYEIVLAAGDGKLNEEGETDSKEDFEENVNKSFDKVVNAISKFDKTITLSVGQLTTGVTIPEWTAVMMLSNVKSPSLYMQAAFRAQNPCLFNGPDGAQYRKKNAYVFDFDPARTLEIVENFATGLHEDTAKGNADPDKRKQYVRELLNFFPVYGEDPDGEMIELDAEKVLSIPRSIHAKEVVNRGFMCNFLFLNVSNVFNAPPEFLDILGKLEPVKEPLPVNEETKGELDINPDGEVEVPTSTVIGTATGIFGDKVYGEVEQKLIDVVDEIKENNGSTENKKDKLLDDLIKKFHTDIASPLITIAGEHYGNDMKASTKKKVDRIIQTNAGTTVKSVYSGYSITENTLIAEKEDKMKKANETGDIASALAIEADYNQKIAENKNALTETLKSKVSEVIQSAGETIVKAIETDKREDKQKTAMDGIKARLRGFSRTIPSFLMAYGTDDTTLENFDKIIPDNVFKDVTSITLDEFRMLRDGFDTTLEDGENKHYTGFFDPIVFNDSVQEFLKKKKELANYFEEDMKEDIFDYIPPQKTNQIFTPKKVVKEMVDLLEKENPGCYDNPDYTFADLYMKSGLYITEIVKKLFRSEKMKELFPNSEDRLNHIFEKQVYGCAPTEIIYRIATAFILGFSDGNKIKKNNLKLFDTLPSAQAGTLGKDLDKIF